MSYYVMGLKKEGDGVKEVVHFTEYENRKCKTPGVKGPTGREGEAVLETAKGLMSKLNVNILNLNLEVLS